MRSLAPTLDAVILDTHQTAAYPEAARELRFLKEASTSLVALVRWCDRNDWGCVPKRIESGARRAAARLAASSGKTGEPAGTCDAEIPGRNDTRCGRLSFSRVSGRSRCVDHLGAGPGRFDRRG